MDKFKEWMEKLSGWKTILAVAATAIGKYLGAQGISLPLISDALDGILALVGNVTGSGNVADAQVWALLVVFAALRFVTKGPIGGE